MLNSKTCKSQVPSCCWGEVQILQSCSLSVCSGCNV